MSTGPAHETSPGPLVPFSVGCSRADGGPLVAEVSGDVDIANSKTLIDAVLAGLDDDPKVGVVLDFTAVDFMDSTGIRAILEIARHLDDAASGLVLLNPAGGVRKLLSLAGLDDRIPVTDSFDQAKAILATPAPPPR
jgi:anti-sigma B factor antagonist